MKHTDPDKSAAPITPADIPKLIAKDLRNIERKVNKQRRPLSKVERDRLQAIADGSQSTTSNTTWAKDQVELAEILGVARQTVLRWRKEGAPAAAPNGLWNVPAWRDWMSANWKRTAEEKEPQGQSEYAWPTAKQTDNGPTDIQQWACAVLYFVECKRELGYAFALFLKASEAVTSHPDVGASVADTPSMIPEELANKRPDDLSEDEEMQFFELWLGQATDGQKAATVPPEAA
jgi:hypothetical protein